MSKSKNFLSDLFDFSFSKFIAPKLAGLLYVIGLIFSGIYTLIFFFGGLAALTSGEPIGLLALIFAPLGFFLYAIFIRVAIESMIIGFRTAENTARTAENTEYLRNQ